MLRLICAVLLMGGAASAAPPDFCAKIPREQIDAILGRTRRHSVSMQLTGMATEGKACSYGGQEYAGLVIVYTFESPAAAQAEMQKIHNGFDKKSIKTYPEKYGSEEGFSFSGGMFAVKNNLMLRVNVAPRVATGRGLINPELTRQLMSIALKAN